MYIYIHTHAHTHTHTHTYAYMNVGMYDEATMTLQSKQSGVLIYVCAYIHILLTHATHAHTRTHTFKASADVRRFKKDSQHYQKTIHLYRGLVYMFIHIYMYIQTHSHTHKYTRQNIHNASADVRRGDEDGADKTFRGPHIQALYIYIYTYTHIRILTHRHTPSHTHTMQVRMYDEATKTLQSTLSGGLGYQRVGHSNRVFSLKFCTENEHMLLSAGWDNTVQVLCLLNPKP